MGNHALKTALTSIAFPDSVTSLGNYMCENRTTITNVVLGTGIKTIGSGAFTGYLHVKDVLPDAHADFVFAVLGEEFGMAACVLVLALFGFIHSVDPRGGIYLPWDLVGLPKVIMWQFAGAYAALAVLLGLLSLQKPEERPSV